MDESAPFSGDRRCFVIAEIGANHNGDLELCKKSMAEAVEAGADAIKLQYYTAKELVADVDRVWAWGPEGQKTEERIGDMFDRLSLSADELREAYRYADALGTVLFCTPFSVQGVQTLEMLGNPIYKVASSDVSFYPMLEAIGALGKPTILSTGKSSLDDVRQAVATLGGVSPGKLALLHCIAQYPAPYDEMNIRVISSFQNLFPGHPIGLSDHSMAHEPALAAVALGARIIEKHFTLDKNLTGPDHWFSMDPSQMKELVQKVRVIEAALGDGEKGIAKCEEWEATYSTRSIIVMRDIKEGQVIAADDLAMLRPGTGLHPRHWAEVIGRRATRDIQAREPVVWDMLT